MFITGADKTLDLWVKETDVRTPIFEELFEGVL
jgi:hypothetical protein